MSEQDRYKQLAELRRWAKYGQLLSGIIHNLNTPLMGISGRVELISFKMPDLKGMDQISRQVQRINDILAPLAGLVDKDLNIERSLTDVNHLVCNVDYLCSASMKYKHRLNVELEIEDSLYAEVFASALQNALFEVCMNAADALPNSGNLKLATFAQNDSLFIRIENDGPPIDDDILARIGEPGVSSREGRLGLGCYIAREAIAICGGTVSWENEATGVSCTVELPLAGSRQ
ncbi:MAG: HAMP domain-containing histidine kinase [Candidatus Cloacimonetes bacterium]|nr:HAMP domain-containing histidine kinase [Candidatus Cloacimonadota bacterium]